VKPVAEINRDAVLKNLTPHPVTISLGGNDDVFLVVTLPPEGPVARISEEVLTEDSHASGIPMRDVAYTRVIDLPDPEPGVYHIVSLPTALAVRAGAGAGPDDRGREDLLVPHGLIRDERGTVIGCQALARVY
jgi:hypothetical protein